MSNTPCSIIENTSCIFRAILAVVCYTSPEFKEISGCSLAPNTHVIWSTTARMPSMFSSEFGII